MHLHHFIDRQIATVARITLYAHQHSRALALRVFCSIVAIVAVIFIGNMLEADVPTIEAWIRDQGAWMPIIFCIIFFIATLLCVPADIFVFIAGTLFGFWWGLLIATVTEYIALIIQFYMSRTVFKTRIQHFLDKHPKFSAIDSAICGKGLKIGFLLRLGPVPFAPLNYVLGVSQMNFRTYMLSSPGLIPSLVPVVYYGYIARHITDLATSGHSEGWLHYATLAVSVIVAMLLTVYVARVARTALKEAQPELGTVHQRKPA